MAELTLKWGTLKAWNFKDSPKGQELIEKYFEERVCMSAILQQDSPMQKNIICELIDLIPNGEVYLDWDGTHVSNQEAKEYVMEYRGS